MTTHEPTVTHVTSADARGGKPRYIASCQCQWSQLFVYEANITTAQSDACIAANQAMQQHAVEHV